MTTSSVLPATGRQPVRPYHTTPRRESSAGWLLVTALVLLVGFAFAALAFIWTTAGQEVDGVLLADAKGFGAHGLADQATTLLSFVGNIRLLAVLFGVILLVGALCRRPWAAVAGICVVLASVAGATVLKTIITRPDFDVMDSTLHNSFPSGHVAAAAALLFALMLALPGWARWLIALPGAVGVSVVAVATMVAGWHRFSDAIGGVLLAGALCCLAAAFLHAVGLVPRPKVR
ncbi:phosphatase PAP2 family protein [Fodinicola feengrottensis]|uniref:phosphatase PAP2 family protein n=1 Tax=Fodinicola feengrottensis TaxID=435914 RepID=UPI0031CF33F3